VGRVTHHGHLVWPPRPSPSEKKSPFRPTATTSISAPLPMSSCLMDRTSIRNLSGKAGAGGIENMHQGIRSLKGWRRKHESHGLACGPIRSRCRRGSGGSASNQSITLQKKCCEIRCEIRGEMGGNLGKLGEGLKGLSPSVHAVWLMFSGLYARGLL
jgi:hypothetical protein